VGSRMVKHASVCRTYRANVRARWCRTSSRAFGLDGSTNAAILHMDQPPARRCAIWVNTTTLIAAQELADFAGVDLDRFIEFVVQELHDHEEREGSFRAPAQDSGPASVIPINGDRRRRRQGPSH
jgi:hypothetical protein